MPGWWAGVGTQALVILVSHLASPQYVLLLFSATESVCEGKQCYKARKENAVAFFVLFQPTQLTAHTSSPLSPGQDSTETNIVVIEWLKVLRLGFKSKFGKVQYMMIMLCE